MNSLSSCLYDCNVMHARIRPKKHVFNHRVFMFYLNLDELDELSNSVRGFSVNKRNLYSFRNEDHLELGASTVKSNIIQFCASKGVDLNDPTIMLLTNVRTFGYIFNPVSFYFCFEKDSNEPVCVVPEIGNTYGELKPYLINKDHLENGKFIDQQKKYYYISPFIDCDVPLEFRLPVPDERLKLQVDDIDAEGKFLYTTLTGKREALTSKSLLKYTCMYPWITLKVITLIHWHAAILHFIKKIPHHAKEANGDLQREVYRVWSKHETRN